MKIALLGYGRMGRLIEKMAADAGDEVIAAIHSVNAEKIGAREYEEAEVLIDFSLPDAALRFIPRFLKAGVPVVSGTTGWKEGQIEYLKKVASEHHSALLYAPNFSVGVNVFFALNEYLAQIMRKVDGYDVRIEEIHHIHKKDAPSGTARALAEEILAYNDKKMRWVNSESKRPEELEIISKREDEVPGTHVISYQSDSDRITLRHEAFSREGFARGALLAARWITGKEGIFTMNDVLGIKKKQ